MALAGLTASHRYDMIGHDFPETSLVLHRVAKVIPQLIAQLHTLLV